jgi:hypothetical protein
MGRSRTQAQEGGRPGGATGGAASQGEPVTLAQASPRRPGAQSVTRGQPSLGQLAAARVTTGKPSQERQRSRA